MSTQNNIWSQIRFYTIITIGVFIHALGTTAGYPNLAINTILIIITIKMLNACIGLVLHKIAAREGAKIIAMIT